MNDEELAILYDQTKFFTHIPTKEFWEGLESIEAGRGITTLHSNLLYKKLGPIDVFESFSMLENEDGTCTQFHYEELEGIEFRYNLLAFILTIPQDMIP